MTGVTCKRYVRAHSVRSWLSSLLFLIADGGRPSGSTAVYDGWVCDYTTYSIYKYATTTSDHVDFRFFIFLMNTWHCHGNYRIHACEVSDPLAPPAWSWQWRAAFPLDSSRSVELVGFAVPFSSVLSKIIQPSPINMWPHNHLHLCRMRIGTTCTHTLLPVIGLGGYPRAYCQLREFYSHRLRILVLVRTFCCIKTD